jgi:DNA mismatch endonuclease (patch repair protein)
MSLRRELHRRGLRYRVDRQVLPGLPRRADIVFSSARTAVFVDGCFWHSCPEHRTSARANGAWWSEKLATNVARDRDTDRRLEEAGWTILRIWEHEDSATAADRVEIAIRSLRERPVSNARTAECR